MLIAFLYGEISGEEKKAVEEYLKENPSRQQELETMGELRTALGKYKDEEDVDIPEIMIRNDNGENGSFWKRWAIAASVALFVSLGWISYRDFENKSAVNAQLQISQAQLQKLIDHQDKMQLQNSRLMEKIEVLEDRVAGVSSEQQDQQQILANLDNKIKRNVDIEGYLVTLQQQNKDIFDQYLQTMTVQQQQYMQTVLTDFNNYIAEQRQEDLILLQNKINTLEQNTDKFQNVTAQLVASLTNTEIPFNNY